MEKETVIKIYISNTDLLEKDIKTLQLFVDKNPNMCVFQPKDELEKISASIQKLSDCLNAYKQSGINWTIFNRYLRGSGVSQREIDNVIGGVERFFEDMGMSTE